MTLHITLDNSLPNLVTSAASDLTTTFIRDMLEAASRCSELTDPSTAPQTPQLGLKVHPKGFFIFDLHVFKH